MNTKKNYIVMTLAILAIGFGLIGVTFAWYSYSNAEGRASGSGISEKPSVVFAQTEYMDVSNIMPIMDEDRYNYGESNSFVVTIPSTLEKYEVSIQINLSDINISSELKSSDFKYELLENNTIISSGNFNSLEDNVLVLLPNTVLNIPSYPYLYNYKLIIWLSDNELDQNNLMNKEFRAKINVVSAVKKR